MLTVLLPPLIHPSSFQISFITVFRKVKLHVSGLTERIKLSDSSNFPLQSCTLLYHQGLLHGLSASVTQQSSARSSEATKIAQGEDGIANLKQSLNKS
jgi:hypothetical protein